MLQPLLRPLLRLFAAGLFGLWLAVAGAEGLQPVPPLQARVTDLTATLSADERSRLEARLAAFERESGAQVAVLIVPTTQPEAIEQYALRVAEQWKLGRRGIDDGALLLIAKQDRKLRIEVGYGLEGALNDASAKRIIAETITPQFRERRFFAGIDAGVERMIAVIRGEALPPPKAPERSGSAADAGAGLDDLWIVGLLLATIVAGILRAIFGRFFGSAIAGGLAGVIVMIVVSSLAIAAIAGLVVFLVALFSGGRGRGWGGSLGSGASDGGGFSGGGGNFGGGGASGDW